MSGTTGTLGLVTIASDGSDAVTIYRTASNTNASKLGNAATLSTGTLGSRPAAGSAGRLYRATDTGHVFFDDGTAWIDLVASMSAPVAKSGAYTAVDRDVVLMSGAHTVTLPSVAVANQRIRIISVDGTGPAPCTIAAAGTDKIKGPGVASAGVATILLGSVGAMVELLSDGTSWRIVAGQQDSGWLGFSYSGGYGTSTNAAYRLTGNTVRLRGSVGGGSGATIATIPAGYRPANTANVTEIDTSGTLIVGLLAVNTSGVVSISATGGLIFPLDSMTYTVD